MWRDEYIDDANLVNYEMCEQQIWRASTSAITIEWEYKLFKYFVDLPTYTASADRKHFTIVYMGDY